MTITFDAIYEDGVLKPERALPLREHEMVRLTIEPHVERILQGMPSGGNCELSIGERIAALARDLPEGALDSLPVDAASQHDHYLYGTPKRSDLR